MLMLGIMATRERVKGITLGKGGQMRQRRATSTTSKSNWQTPPDTCLAHGWCSNIVIKTAAGFSIRAVHREP